jgi:hypothetical protein
MSLRSAGSTSTSPANIAGTLKVGFRLLLQTTRYGAILDAASDAWNRLIEKPYKIMSLGLRPWAYTGHYQ